MLLCVSYANRQHIGRDRYGTGGATLFIVKRRAAFWSMPLAGIRLRYLRASGGQLLSSREIIIAHSATYKWGSEAERQLNSSSRSRWANSGQNLSKRALALARILELKSCISYRVLMSVTWILAGLTSISRSSLCCNGIALLFLPIS